MRHTTRSNTPDDFRPRIHLPRPVPEPGADGTEQQQERAILVTVLLPDTKADFQNPFGELSALAETAGVEVVDSMSQKRQSLGTAFALGKGKLQELVERVEANDAETVIFDNDLTPRQIRGLERAVNRKVIDRTELILDIFASHAKTRESQLQVELAQLEYTAPRLRGLWTHLERIAGAGGATAAGAVGGVGTRGPGERQIEIDRRIAQKRISHLKREIREIDDRKRREVTSRGDQFTVSLVGYTNSGKSTLMNALTGTNRLAADLLFATLETKTVRWELGEGRSALLSDTVGFIRDLPHRLIASFKATLEEAVHADLLLHVVDAAAPTAYRQMQAVDEVLAGLRCDELPQILVLNKTDIADPGPLAELLIHRKTPSLRISAKTGAGLDKLAEEVYKKLAGETAEVTIRIPQRDGRLIAEIDRHADVRDRRYVADAVEADICMNRAQLRQLLGRHPSASIIRGCLERSHDGEPNQLQ